MLAQPTSVRHLSESQRQMKLNYNKLLGRWMKAVLYDNVETDIGEKMKYLPYLIDLNRQLSETIQKIGMYTPQEVEEGFYIEE